MGQPLRPKITRDGQPYLDKPIVVAPKPQKRTRLELSIQAAFDPRGLFAEQPRRSIVVGHERIYLRWMKPDGKGGLVPRGGGRR